MYAHSSSKNIIGKILEWLKNWDKYDAIAIKHHSRDDIFMVVWLLSKKKIIAYSS